MALTLNKHAAFGTLTYAQVDENWTAIEQSEVNLQGQINILQGIGLMAEAITIADAGGYYTSSNVEGALQEVGAMLGDVGAALDAINGEVVP